MTVDSHYPSPGGQVSEMAEVGGRRRRLLGAVRHLLDLHKGYHAPPRTYAWQGRPAVSMMYLTPPCRAPIAWSWTVADAVTSV